MLKADAWSESIPPIESVSKAYKFNLLQGYIKNFFRKKVFEFDIYISGFVCFLYVIRSTQPTIIPTKCETSWKFRSVHIW